MRAGHNPAERFYEEVFPQVEETVMIRVTRTESDTGAYANLLEYGNLEGMILGKELSKRRVRSIQKVVKIGRLEVALVLRVDTEKGYVDLSKKRVAQGDFERCQQKYVRGKTVFQLMNHLTVPSTDKEAEQLPPCSVEYLNQKIAWPLTRKYGDPLQALRNATSDPSILYDTAVDVDKRILDRLLETLRMKMTPTVMKFRMNLSLYCYDEGGVDTIKSAFEAGIEAFNSAAKDGMDVTDFRISLIAAPKYAMTASSLHKEEGIKRLEVARDAIAKSITALKTTENAIQNVFNAEQVRIFFTHFRKHA
eukprot:GHVP01070864.1.p1 GENE.GHVP01070864.1~~GHVP01070864.1.p1  ORF type:complete len:314 (+),score=49.08 GHVP01070864.1:23-943(+)